MSQPSEPESDAPIPEPADTPFDHPMFLPALFLAGCAWFGYDGYLNDDPDMLEHLEFNRFGLRVMVYATAVSGLRGWCELRDRAAPPFAMAGLHALFALWLAFDGWLNPDPWYAIYKSFNRLAAGAMGGATLWWVFADWRRGAGGREPPFVLPALTALASALFFSRAREGGDLALLYGSTAVGIAVVALWLLRRDAGQWRRDRRKPSDAADA